METRVAEVKVVGEVRAVELRDDGGGVFRLRLEDGTVVSGDFAADYAAVVTQAFQLHRWSHLGVKGDGEFDGEGSLCHIPRVQQYRVVSPGEEPIFHDPETPSDKSDNWLQKIAKELDEKYPATEEEPAVDVGQHILEVFEELRATHPIPDEERLPTDFAKNLKHYLYGFPKEE